MNSSTKPWGHVIWLRRAILLLPVLGLFLFASGCDSFFVSEGSVQSVAVSPSAIILAAASSSSTTGDSFPLKSQSTTVGGTTADDTTTAKWTSNNSKITVQSTGDTTPGLVTVNGDTTGGDTATITATDGASGTASVFVYAGTAATDINFTGTTGTVATGQQIQLNVTLVPSGTVVTTHVVYTSSNPNVASVNANGLVTILGTTGSTATITISAYVGAPGATTQPQPFTQKATYTVL